MGGGLIQLATFGKQDDYIMGNPEITFFKSVYRMHTNFAIETIQQIIDGNFNTDTTNTDGMVTISKGADMLSKIYIVCPQTTAGIKGLELVDTVEFIIGGTLIDKHTSEWNKVWSELTIPKSKTDGYKYMVGGYGGANTPLTDQSTIIVPLNFWFCRHIGLSIPLISIQYHDIKLKIKWGINSDINRDGGATSSSCEVWVDNIFLDQDERKRFSAKKHEYLIEQIQIVDSSPSGPSTKYKLNSINHPVKELIWVEGNTGVNRVTTEKFGILMNGIDRLKEREKEYFTLQQPMNHHTSIPGYNIKENGFPILLSTHLSVGTSNLDTPNTYGDGTTDIDPTAGGSVVLIQSNTGTIPKVGDIVMIKETGADSSTQTGPVISTVKTVNTTGTSIVLSNDDIGVGGDFHLHIIGRSYIPQSNCSDYEKNIYVYSFCLNPEEHQPSGICNFTGLDNIKLTISLSRTIDKIYAINYNVMRISNGLVNLLYT